MCRSRRELSNEYLVAKIGVDTAENEPSKVCPLSVYRSPRFPKEYAAPAAPVAVDEAGKRIPPTYPIRVPLSKLAEALTEARDFGLPAVIVHGSDENSAGM